MPTVSASPKIRLKTQTRIAIEEKLDELVTEAQRVGLTLMDISAMLELKLHSVNEAMNESI
jgi:hypothetical protein